MTYIICPSCGTLLGSYRLKLITYYKDIENDPNKTIEEKNKHKTDFIYNFKLKYCCNIRLLSDVDIYDIFKKK